ncbi:hypothetical protein JTB14_021929 [Gonioctena quinquepunctata]|nr:hypothetical protein JTB14_021929 [Gonioctena quinquepunctata]
MNLTENDECSSISLSLCEHFSKNTNNSRSLDIRNQSSSSSNYSLKFSSAEQYDIGLKSLEISQTQLSANRNNMDLPESNKLMGITKSSVYKDYVSPIVEVVEGLNNATLSWEENGREMLEKSHDTGITISEDYEKIPMNLDKRDDNTLPNNISVHFEDHKGNDHFQSLQSNSPSINGSFIHNIPPSDNIISQKIENKLINNYKVQNESISQAFSFENEKKSHTSESMILGKNSKNLVKLSPSPKAVHICNETSSYSKLMQSGRISFCSDPNGHFSEKQCSTPTSISNASKKRNLDEASTNSTSEMTSNNHENGSEQSGEVDKFDQKSLTQVSLEKKVFDNHQSPTCHQSPTILNTDFEIVVSIQETSNLKKLHESITNFSVIKKLISSTTSLSKTPDKMHLNESRNRSTPKTSESSSNEIKHSDKAQINGINGRILRKRKTPKKKFVPPNKLTAREIRRDFEEQDRKILENDRNSPNITKYLEQIIKRPTIKQIQSGTQLALIRKSNHGVQVIPAEPTTRKKHKPLLQRNYSNEDFNVSIFSDKNAKPFEEYLNSSEIDYKTFRSNCSLNENLPSFSSIDRQSCSFTLVRRATLEDDKKTFQICETRGKNIETFFEDSSQLTNDQFSYPKGTYKKKEINNIIDKYLKNDYSFISPSQVQQRNVEKNIFDKNNSNEDSVV